MTNTGNSAIGSELKAKYSDIARPIRQKQTTAQASLSDVASRDRTAGAASDRVGGKASSLLIGTAGSC
jgi:hypothetical protein